MLGRRPGPFTVTPLRHNAANPVTADISRIDGDGWAYVRKVVVPGADAGAPHWEPSDVPGHWNYWRREIEAYTGGFTRTVYAGSGVRGPRLRAALDVDVPGESGGVALWLDAEPGLPGTHWPVERFGRFAEQLGRGQGRYLAGEPVPTLPWLSRGFLRQYALESQPVDGSVYGDDTFWAYPAVEQLRPLRDRLHALWEERELYTTVVESLPATVCHLDVWPPNLVADGARSVLLDWSFAGLGAVGEDVGNLVPDCVFDGWLPPADLPALDAAVTAGHLAGLGAAGWAGDPREVRLGTVAAGAAKYCWLAERVARRAVEGSTAGYGGTDDPGRLGRMAAVLRFVLGWADEARDLAAALPSRRS